MPYKVDYTYTNQNHFAHTKTTYILCDTQDRVSEILIEVLRPINLAILKCETIKFSELPDTEPLWVDGNREQIIKLNKEVENATQKVKSLKGWLLCITALSLIISILGYTTKQSLLDTINKQNDTIYSQKIIIDSFKRVYPKEFKNIIPK